LPQGRTSPVRDAVLGTALRLLYLAGLRAGELLRLTQADVNLDAGLLHIRHTKFDKSRMVPIAPDLAQHLVHCRTLVTKRFAGGAPEKPFFPSPRGGRYSITALRAAFHQTLKTAGIEGTSGNRHIRLHDLRHSMAVLRLLLWCVHKQQIRRQNRGKAGWGHRRRSNASTKLSSFVCVEEDSDRGSENAGAAGTGLRRAPGDVLPHRVAICGQQRQTALLEIPGEAQPFVTMGGQLQSRPRLGICGPNDICSQSFHDCSTVLDPRRLVSLLSSHCSQCSRAEKREYRKLR